MTIDEVVTIANDALYIIIKVSAPILIVSLIVGLIVSIFQTVTSIQEQTLTFVPKVLVLSLMLLVLGSWMITTFSEFFNSIFELISGI